jgi:hypothetical protein
MEPPNQVDKAARKYFADRFGDRKYAIVRTASDTDPQTKRSIYLFVARPIGQSPESSTELVLDEEGRPVELPHVREGRFSPAIPLVPPELVAAVTVTVSPTANTLRLSECDTFSETLTVSIPASSAVAPADIYFLADNTGSMGPAISQVQSGASAIFAALSPLAGLQFGVGSYRDFENPGDPGSGVFQNLQPITANTAAVSTAIGTWSATGGGDGPEAQFYALDQIAQPPAGPIGWRPGVAHIVVWFGDAPGHDPICTAVTGLPNDIDEASVTAKLQANNITVLALALDDGPISSGGSGYPAGLDDDPTNLQSALNAAYTPCGTPGGTTGQATRIAAATDGIVVASVDPSTIVNTIIAQLKALLTIKNVHLQPDAAIAPFVTSITPASYGPLPADQDNFLTFDVTFSGDAGDCARRDKLIAGAIDVVVDGNVVAAKPTDITIPACKYSYAVKFVCGTQNDCGCACGPIRPGTYATEINIFNPKCKDAHLTKRVVPLVFAGATTGREPAVAQARAADQIVLPSGSATLDDCCRITQLLYGGVTESPMPLTVGFVEIISDQQLQVTAVYTASDLNSRGVSLDVQTVPFTLT